MSQGLRERLQALRHELDQVVGAGKSCLPAVVVLGITVPLVVWAILYFSQLSIVMDDDPNDPKGKSRSTKKLGLWVGGVTVVIWLILYLLTYVPAFQSGLICMFY
jgi:Mn2+/Fe2+ NRAMP family transporter